MADRARLAVVALALAVACSRGTADPARVPSPAASDGARYEVRFDALGYAPDDDDRSVVVVSSGAPPTHYRIEDGDGRVVARGRAGPRVLSATSRAGTPIAGDRIDLAALAAGTYAIVLDDGTRAGPITIAPGVDAPLVPAMTRFLATQRCGPTTKAASLHGACHLHASLAHAHSGDAVAVDDGARPPYASSTAVDAEGGWHDAGDYLKFVGTTAYVLAVDLMALHDHRAALGRAGDDLADELRWGLDWLLKMVAGAEPYHQVGGEGDHETGWRAPEDDTRAPIAAYDRRPLFRMAKGRGRNLLGRSAAAFAFGAGVYANDAPYARTLLDAAKKAYALARARPDVQNPDPPDFYAERTGDDDLVLGAAALARATGEAIYVDDARTFARRLAPVAGTAIGWGSLDALALLEAARVFAPGSIERADLARRLDDLAAPIAATARAPTGPGAAFGYALPSFGNGSLAESLGAAATCLAARRLDGPRECATVARRQIHWLLGANPFGVSFVVGVGRRWPRNLHHALAQASHVAIPGAIVGGPSTLVTITGAGLPAPRRDGPLAAWSTDDLLYEDDAGDYVCNEPAIDFGAALVFDLAELADPPAN